MASANVFASLLQPVKSVQEYDDERNAREINRLALMDRRRQSAIADQTYQQQQSDRNALQQFAQQSGGDPNKLVQLLRGSGSSGLMQQADALEKGILDRRNTESLIGERTTSAAGKQFENSEAKRKSAIQQIVSLNSPQEAKQLLDLQVQQGAVGMQAAQAISRMIDSDPKWQVRLVAGINDPKEMLAALQPHFQNAGGALVNTNPLAGPMGQGQPNAIAITQSADNAATQETARRGQNMTDARARETNQLTREAQATTYDPERGMLVNRATGLARPAATIDGKPLGAKDKPLTDSQAKAYAFGSRMSAANEVIDQLEKAGTRITTPGMGGNGVLGRAITALAPEQQQQLEQAKRDWINANLRRESGAVIGQSEFDSADRQYFAQPGDKPETIKQKAANRKRAEQGVLAEVPDGKKAKPAAVDTGGVPDDIAAILKKHGGK